MKKRLSTLLPGPFTFFVLVVSLTMASRTNPVSNQAEVNQVQGILIFTDCKPVQSYEYLGTVKNTGRVALSGQYQPVRDHLIKKLKKEYPAANGAIFRFNNGSADFADAIKIQ